MTKYSRPPENKNTQEKGLSDRDGGRARRNFSRNLRRSFFLRILVFGRITLRSFLDKPRSHCSISPSHFFKKLRQFAMFDDTFSQRDIHNAFLPDKSIRGLFNYVQNQIESAFVMLVYFSGYDSIHTTMMMPCISP